MQVPVRSLILIIGGVLVVAGSQSLWTAIRNRSPTRMSCAQYLAAPPAREWLELTDCDVSYREALKVDSEFYALKVDSTFYAPVRAPGDDDEPVQLVVRTPSAATLKGSTITVKGLVLRGMDADGKVRDELERSHAWKLAATWKILDTTAAPSFDGGAFMLALGILLLLWRYRRWHREEAARAAAAAAAAPRRIAELTRPP